VDGALAGILQPRQASSKAPVAIITIPASHHRHWRSRFAALSWGLSALGLVVCSICLAYATVVEVRRITRVLPPTPPEVARDVIVRNAVDLTGRRASFRILLFTDEFRWRLSSDEAIENVPAQPDFTPEMKVVLNDAREIICIGASSEEIPGGVSFEKGRAKEERRAARRAERIAVWVRGAVSRPIPVRKLNIGHHAPTGRARDTSDQRRVVIILVLDYDEDANIDQALRSAMARETVRAPIFEALLTQYSLGAATSFTWVE
jgi:hypothetical protein